MVEESPVGHVEKDLEMAMGDGGGVVLRTTGCSTAHSLLFWKVLYLFLLTNFFVIPLATVILYLTALMFVSALVPPLLPWMAKALAVVVGWQNGLAKGVASLPGSSIEGISLSRLQLLMVYVIIIAAATIVYKVLRLKNKI